MSNSVEKQGVFAWGPDWGTDAPGEQTGGRLTMRAAPLVAVPALVALALGTTYGYPRLAAREGAPAGSCEAVALAAAER